MAVSCRAQLIVGPRISKPLNGDFRSILLKNSKTFKARNFAGNKPGALFHIIYMSEIARGFV